MLVIDNIIIRIIKFVFGSFHNVLSVVNEHTDLRALKLPRPIGVHFM